MEVPVEKKAMVKEATVESGSLMNGHEPIDPYMEKRVVGKCDLHVLPVLSVLYMVAFLDRINIGNARIQGLEEDLNMNGQQYNIALQVFFIPYILFEVPSNIFIRKLAPSTWLCGIMLGWGLVTVCMGVTQSFAGLVVCRVLLGFFEAGFLPGCLYLFSMYYKRHELQRRFNLFFGLTILSGAASGFFAYALGKMAGVGGYSGWRWIFIIEGLGTVVLAIVSKFFVADWPETAKFLTTAERALVVRRIHEDAAGAAMNDLGSKSRRRILFDWKIWCGAIMYLGCANSGYSGAFFTPTILKQLGWTSTKAQLYTIPIYAVSAAVTVATAFLSDRLRHRYALCVFGICVNAAGYAMLLAPKHVPVDLRYVALYFTSAGGYIAQPLTLVWMNNNLGGHYKKGIGSAMQIGIGNLGGIIASNIYIAKEAPAFPVGFGTSLALSWLTAIACTVFFVGLRRENRKRDRGGRDYRYNLPKSEQESLGDDHPRFRFVY
ncbi:MAG: hypothetical protein Q9208_000930 [Pyrenodesmia sp. 3 TL-2023]